jgi:tetratricopeptide (TPR) repeat protein
VLAAIVFIVATCATDIHAQTIATQEEADIAIFVAPDAQRAEAALKQLQAGWDFGVLCREESVDPTGENGGYLGRLKPAELRPELRNALAGLRVGEYSHIVPLSSGYAILTILPRAPVAEHVDGSRIRAMTHTGEVRPGIDIGGYMESLAAFKAEDKPEGWNRDLNQVCSIRRQANAKAIAGLEQLFAAPDAKQMEIEHPLNVLRDHVALSQLYAYMGNLRGATVQYQAGLDLAKQSVPDAIPHFEEGLGVQYLHLSEMENGIYHDNGEQDIFPPLDPKAHFTREDDSQQAVNHLEAYLGTNPEDYQARWLLNLAYATLGRYPDGVPKKYLIPPAVFQSAENVGRFKDIAPAVGLKAFMDAGGVVVDDFENNGLLDVFVSSQDECDHLYYFHNNGDGTFSDRSEQAGVMDQLGGLNIVKGDYNNDGCIDLLVLRGGWEYAVRKSLLRNNCNGTFTDVTEQSGLNDRITSSQSAVWADIDNDGYLDLFVANEGSAVQLYHNRGDGTFEDIAKQAGVDKVALSKAVTAADYDNDGYVDFYVSNFSGPNFLYHNNGNNTFTEIGEQAGVREPIFSFAAWFFDYDNDGWPDLFVESYFSSIDECVRNAMGLPTRIETLKLYRNLHNGAFEDVTAKVGLDKIFLPMGAGFGDVDNDGYLDLYLGMGTPSLGSMMPHVLLRNDQGKKFVDITQSSGTGELHKGHGIAFADLRRNGDEDIIAEVGGAIPSDRHTVRLFQNPGNRNDWINVKLVGVKTNRSAVGAKIEVQTEDSHGALRSISRTVGEKSSFGDNPLEQHIGLGPDVRRVTINTWWPATNTRQHFSSVGKNRFIEIKEFAKQPTHLDRTPVTMGDTAKPAHSVGAAP